MKSTKQKIYVRLIDGTVIFVPVYATQISGQAYRICDIEGLDLNDATSIWEYFPGDVVACESKTFKNGSIGLVAAKLLGSTMPHRKLFDLIFKIVDSESGGQKIDFTDYSIEITRIKSGLPVRQILHPAVQRWLKKV